MTASKTLIRTSSLFLPFPTPYIPHPTSFYWDPTPINYAHKTARTGAPWNRFYRRIFTEFIAVPSQKKGTVRRLNPSIPSWRSL